MKLANKTTNVDRMGVYSESQFTIKTTAKSFEILSSGLYTDPITAVIRELSSNAYDAHTFAEKPDVPFVIHLPSTIEPFFSVTDYGIGLSDDQIQGVHQSILNEDGNEEQIRVGGLYTTYFESTKTHSNDFIGALGLGSKSPFSYTDAFIVISKFERTQNTYSVFLNEDNIPSIALLSTITTDECNGVEVRLSVKPTDFSTFRRKTAMALRFFPVTPTVLGVTEFNFRQVTPTLSGDTWQLTSSSSSDNKIIAVQGNVPYKVNKEHILDGLSSEERSFINQVNIILFFKIGDLDIAANREEIRYDSNTIKTVHNSIIQFANNIYDYAVNGLLKTDNSYWQSITYIQDISVLMNVSERQLHDLLIYKNSNAVTKNEFIDSSATHIQSLQQHTIVRYTIKPGFSRVHRCPTYTGTTLYPNNRTKVFVNDTSGGVGRIKQFIQSTVDCDTVVLITQNKKPEPPVPIDFDVDIELQDIINDLGNPKILYVSKDTAAPQKIKRVRSVYAIQSLATYHVPTKRRWNKININNIMDSSDVKLYLSFDVRNESMVLNGRSLCWGSDIIDNIRLIIKLVNEHTNNDYTIHDLYGIPGNMIKLVKGNDNWLSIDSMMDSIIQRYLPTINVCNKIQKTSSFLDIKNHATNNKFMTAVESLGDNSEFKKLVTPIISDQLSYPTYNDHCITFLSELCSTDDKIKEYFLYNTFDKYPMLQLVNSNIVRNIPIIFEYINNIDTGYQK